MSAPARLKLDDPVMFQFGSCPQGHQGTVMAAAIENIYALDVSDVPVLTFAATTFHEAQSLRREQWLRTDLIEARSNGAPVWDGKSKLTVRRASAEEAARFGSAIKEASDGSATLFWST